MNELKPSLSWMSQTHWSDDDFGTEQWRRRMVFEHVQVKLREQQRLRLFGQIFAMAALILIGAMSYWAAQALGLDISIESGELRRGTVVATFLLGSGILILAVILWGARLKLGRSELELLKRDLASYSSGE